MTANNDNYWQYNDRNIDNRYGVHTEWETVN